MNNKLIDQMNKEFKQVSENLFYISDLCKENPLIEEFVNLVYSDDLYIKDSACQMLLETTGDYIFKLSDLHLFIKMVLIDNYFYIVFDGETYTLKPHKEGGQDIAALNAAILFNSNYHKEKQQKHLDRLRKLN